MNAVHNLWGVAVLCGAMLTAGPPLAAAVGPAAPRAAPLSGVLYFQRGSFIYAANADGSGVHQVTQTGTAQAGDTRPALSPDGSRLAYAHNGTIAVIPTAGGVARVVAQEPRAQDPAWSPDGRRLAFDWNWYCYHVGAGGGHMSYSSTISVVEVGTGRRVAMLPCRVGYTFPTWSHDGSAIIADAVSYAGTLELDAFDVTHSPPQNVGLTNDSNHDYDTPAVSPDGQFIACIRVASGAGSGVLWVLNADGSGGHAVAPVADVGRPAWSPDGTTIAFTHAGAIYTVPAAGGTPVLLIDNAQDPAWGGNGPTSPPVATPRHHVSLTLTTLALLHTVNGNAQQTTTLHLGEKALFIAVYHSSPTGAGTPTGALTILKGGRAVGSLTMQATTTSDGTHVLYALTRFTDTTLVGSLRARVALHLGGARVSRSLAFTLQPVS